MTPRKLFDENRYNERITVSIQNLRNIISTHCIDGRLDKLSDSMIAMAIGPSLDAYDEELGAMFEQYRSSIANNV